MSSPTRHVIPAVSLTDCRNCRVTIHTATDERPRFFWFVRFCRAIGNFSKWVISLASRLLAISLGCTVLFDQA